MATELYSTGGAAHAHGWGHSANHTATPASWIAAGGSSSGDKRVHAWASAHEQDPAHWAPTDSAAAVACPRPCQHVVVEIADAQSELPADSSWVCAMDEAELHKSVDLYLPEETFVMTNMNSSSDNIPCTASQQQSHAESTTPVSSLPTASFSLLGALSLLRPQLRSETQHAPAAQRQRKRVSIGTTSVVREYVPTGSEVGEAAPGVNCCDAEKKEHGMTLRDLCSPTHTADGPRAENLLLDRLIVTHFEGWALTNPGAIAKFVGGDDLLRQVGPGLIDRLEEMIASLDSGAVQHVGVLPSCVRMGVNHLPHLRTLHTWVVAGFQFVSTMEEPPPECSYDGEAGDYVTDDSDSETPSSCSNGAYGVAQDQQMDQDQDDGEHKNEDEMEW